MRSIICLAVVLALMGLTGCAKNQATPSDQTPQESEASAEPQPIASEDFESGETGGMVESDENPEESANSTDGADKGDTP